MLNLGVPALKRLAELCMEGVSLHSRSTEEPYKEAERQNVRGQMES